jgi:hypothetical protein
MKNATNTNTKIYLAVAFILSIISFINFVIFIKAVSGLKPWSDVESFMQTVNTPVYMYLQMDYFFGLLSVVFFGILAVCLHEYAAENKKILSRISMMFANSFLVTACIYYSTQLFSINENISIGQTNGLEMFIAINPTSFSYTLALLSWSILFPLSLISAAFIFQGTILKLATKTMLLLSGALLLFSAIFHALNAINVSALTNILGLFLSMPVSIILITLVFWKDNSNLNP